MKLYRKQHREADTNWIAERIANSILAAQQKTAVHINRKLQQLPKQTLRFAFVGLALAFGAYCLYLLFSAFNYS